MSLRSQAQAHDVGLEGPSDPSHEDQESQEQFEEGEAADFGGGLPRGNRMQNAESSWGEDVPHVR